MSLKGFADSSGNQSGWLDPGVYRVKKAHLHWLSLEGHALGHIARNRLPTAKKFLFGWKLSPSLDVLDPSHGS
jgi:hypothetical protein